GHVPDEITAQDASAAGQRTIEHLTGIPFGCSSRQQGLMGESYRARFFRDKLAIEAEAYHDIDQAKCEALFAEFRANDTWQVPTLTVPRLGAKLADARFLADSRLAYIDKRYRDRWFDRTSFQRERWNNGLYNLARDLFKMDEQITGAMFRAGVPMMAGTD